MLEVGKGSLCSLTPLETGLGRGECGEGASHSTVIPNKPPVKISKPQELLETTSGGRGGPVCYRLQFRGVHLDLGGGDDEAQKKETEFL